MAFALGLAFFYFVVVISIQLLAPWAHSVDVPLAAVASFALAFGGAVATEVITTEDGREARVVWRTLFSLLAAMAVFLYRGMRILGDSSGPFGKAQFLEIVEYGGAALIVTVLWALIYGTIERRLESR
ncbi:MAG TPA: hypothetical protein VMI56_22810 [Reyranella sp.]|nr:hypothetical protein [Reyranella sp.]